MLSITKPALLNNSAWWRCNIAAYPIHNVCVSKFPQPMLSFLFVNRFHEFFCTRVLTVEKRNAHLEVNTGHFVRFMSNHRFNVFFLHEGVFFVDGGETIVVVVENCAIPSDFIAVELRTCNPTSLPCNLRTRSISGNRVDLLVLDDKVTYSMQWHILFWQTVRPTWCPLWFFARPSAICLSSEICLLEHFYVDLQSRRPPFDLLLGLAICQRFDSALDLNQFVFQFLVVELDFFFRRLV